MIVIPDYLIIDEIRRREEQSKHPLSVNIPLPAYDIPDADGTPVRENPVKRDKQPKNSSGVIIIDLNTYQRL